MSNKEIQEARMKGYFIEATKELLKGEGLKSVSVRNIADKAGYSYATIYNYFRDVKELVFICVKDFQDECEAFVREEIKAIPHGTDRLKGLILAYIKYFVQYPGIFELFFLERLSDMASGKDTPELIYTFFDRLSQKDWSIIAGESIMEESTILQARKEFNLMVTGMLLFYLNRNIPATYAEFSEMSTRLITVNIDNYRKIKTDRSPGSKNDDIWSY